MPPMPAASVIARAILKPLDRARKPDHVAAAPWRGGGDRLHHVDDDRQSERTRHSERGGPCAAPLCSSGPALLHFRHHGRDLQARCASPAKLLSTCHLLSWNRLSSCALSTRAVRPSLVGNASDTRISTRLSPLSVFSNDSSSSCFPCSCCPLPFLAVLNHLDHFAALAPQVREITVHRDGILRAPLPRGIGSCAYVDDISDDEVEEAFAQLSEFMKAHPEVYWDPSKSFSAA